MDRIDAMRVFVTAVGEGSLARAGVKLGKSPAAVSRAIVFLENHAGTELLYRTTRSLRLSAAGERYLAACRRILSELDDAQNDLAGERSRPRGLLTITAPVAAGETLLQPIADAFMDENPAVNVRLHLFDQPSALIDEGIDVALRIAHLPDSSLVAIRVGEVRRVVVAAPGYLEVAPPILEPADLAKQEIVAMAHFGQESWSFPPLEGSAVPRVVVFTPRFIVNSIRGAVASAVAGRGVTRLFSYHAAREIRDGALRILLEGDEHDPLPVHLVSPQGRLQIPKVRAFADFAVPRLKAFFAEVGADIAAVNGILPQNERLSAE